MFTTQHHSFTWWDEIRLNYFYVWSYRFALTVLPSQNIVQPLRSDYSLIDLYARNPSSTTFWLCVFSPIFFYIFCFEHWFLFRPPSLALAALRQSPLSQSDENANLLAQFRVTIWLQKTFHIMYAIYAPKDWLIHRIQSFLLWFKSTS